MNFVKKLVVLCFVGLAFQQASYAMDAQAYRDAKKNLRNAVIKESLKQEIDDVDDMNLIGKALGVLHNLRNENQEVLMQEDVIFNDGENIFTLFAKNTTLKDDYSLINMSFREMVEKAIEHLGFEGCVNVIKKENREGKAFIAIVFERKLLPILFSLLYHRKQPSQKVFSDIILKTPMHSSCFLKRKYLVKESAFLSYCLLEEMKFALSMGFTLHRESDIEKTLLGIDLKKDFPCVFEKFLPDLSDLPDLDTLVFCAEVPEDINLKKIILEKMIVFSIKNGLFENKDLCNIFLEQVKLTSNDIDLKIKNLDHSSDKKKLAVMLRSRWMDVTNRLKKIVCKNNMPHAIFKAQKNRDYVNCSVITK
ncbi:hypothetical protein ACFLYA_02355 [Candidatus Dependentiae bacterium]